MRPVIVASRWATAGALVLALGFVLANSACAGTLTIANRSRPVMRAILQLMATYGYEITYEEPRVVYQGDLEDVTQQRRDLNRFPPGQAPKVYRPIGGSIQLALPDDAPDQQAMYGVLNNLVESWRDSNQGGAHFQVEQQDGIFHVIPLEIRDVNGNWQPVQSVLATPISLPSNPRTERDMFDAIARAISANASTKVVCNLNGGFIIGLRASEGATKTYVIGAQNEPADSVLARAFELVGQKMTWILTYSPTMHWYFLNIDNVSTMPNQMIWPPELKSPSGGGA